MPRIQGRRLWCGVSLAAIFLAPAGWTQATEASGEDLAQVVCSSCHASVGAHHNLGRLRSLAAIATDPACSAAALRAFLRLPHYRTPDPQLQPADIDRLIAYILSLKGT